MSKDARDPDIRERIMEEVVRLRNEILNCAHCAACRNQMIRLHHVLPPEPISANGLMYYYTGPLAPVPREFLPDEDTPNDR